MKFIDHWIEDSKPYRELLHATIRIQEEHQRTYAISTELAARLAKSEQRATDLQILAGQLLQHVVELTQEKGKREHKAKRK